MKFWITLGYLFFVLDIDYRDYVGMNKTLFHDGKKNNVFIIKSEEDAEEINKKVVSYIFILIKS